MFTNITELIDSIRARDPSARSRTEVVLCFPGFHAILWYRLNNWLWRRGAKLIARFLGSIARILTGIEIHPAANIGANLFIDHGFGVVIGETVTIGDNVTIYQGVTLGGISPSINSDQQRQQKRHPTLEEGVIIGAGAKLLGAITVGAFSRIGANSIVIKDVAPRTTILSLLGENYDKQKLNNKKSDPCSKFIPYGTVGTSGPASLQAELATQGQKLAELQQLVAELRAEITEHSSRLNT